MRKFKQVGVAKVCQYTLCLIILAATPSFCMQVTKHWTAPEGDPVRYDLRYVPLGMILNDSTWDSCKQMVVIPTSAPSGDQDSVTLDLSTGVYFMAMKSYDGAGNCSGISNIDTTFVGNVCETGDTNHDGDVNMSDVVYMIQWIFNNGSLIRCRVGK